MSKLTNCQIEAQIRTLKAGIAAARRRGDAPGVRRRTERLVAYRAELAERQSKGLNPGTEIQAVRFGETGRSKTGAA